MRGIALLFILVGLGLFSLNVGVHNAPVPVFAVLDAGARHPCSPTTAKKSR